MKLSRQQRIHLGFAASIVFLLFIAMSAWWNARQTVAAFRDIDQGGEVLDQLDQTLIMLLNAETGTRGFVITGDEAFLEPYQIGLASLRKSFGDAPRPSQHGPLQHVSQSGLKPLVQKRMAYLEELIQLRRGGDTSGAFRRSADGQGKLAMDEIREFIGEMQAEENQLLRQRSIESQARIRTTVAMVVLVCLLAIALVALAKLLSRRDLLKQQQSDAEHNHFFSHSLDMFGIAGTDGYFKRINPAFGRTLGWSEEEFMARPFLDFVHLEDQTATQNETINLASGNPTHNFDNRYRCKDGSYRWLAWRAFPRANGSIYAMARDVTELKEAEGVLLVATAARDLTERQRVVAALAKAAAELKENNARLDKERTALAASVAQRTAELTDANTELAKASQAKSEFLATMSHELRTPLNGILGMNELLLGTELNVKQRQYGEACSSSGKLLVQLINDILDLSKIEAGKVELEEREFDMEALVYDVADMMALSARQKGLIVRCNLSGETCVVAVGDANRLRQVLMNLVNNAVKFSSVGSVTIHCTRATQSDGAVRLRCAIVDTGIGIPAERRDRLFQAFSQVDNSTTRRFGGTGLGLSICRQLVELMGGQIGVESQVGVGSTFWFEFPTRIISEHSGLQRTRRVLAGTRVISVKGPGVERTQITECLASWDCPLAQVATGEEALSAVLRATGTEAPFRIALVDCQLVGDDEYVVMQKLNSIPDLHVIGLGAPDDASIDFLHTLGVRHVLRDPIRPSDLLNAIASVLSVSDGTTENPAAISRPRAGSIFGHVLVAEDNRINQLYIVDLLKDFGCTVELVVNGEEAIAAVELQRYDLLLMDSQMPEMDGYAATREIRRREALQVDHRRLPIIALTANALKGDRERCLEAGMDAYVSKPIESERLLCLLEKYLRESPAMDQIVAAPALACVTAP
jgi:PAS domain S-box-containing protein